MIAKTLTREVAVCLSLLFAFAQAAPDKVCDRSQCKGPLKYYEELKCKPVFAQPGDCCPVSYDCSNLNDRKPYKCYANGHEYSIGESVRYGDYADPCESNCMCISDQFRARFICAMPSCAGWQPKDGCYLVPIADTCCGSKEICPKIGEEQITCRSADGKVYLEGQQFQPKQLSELMCTCMKGFKGEFVEPFCKKITCPMYLHNSAMIDDKCSPVFYGTESPSVRCSLRSSFRCPSYQDQVIKAAGAKSPDNTGAKTNEKCKFGNIMMEVGDKLNEVSEHRCVKCTCEVPPALTCLLDTECFHSEWKN